MKGLPNERYIAARYKAHTREMKYMWGRVASFKQRGREIERSLKWLQEKVGTTHLNVCVYMCEPSRQMGPFWVEEG